MSYKRRSLIFIMLFSFVLLFFGLEINVKATDSDNGLGSYLVVEQNDFENYVYTSYKSDSGLSTANGTTSNQNVTVFSQRQTDNSKVVTWAISTGSGFVRDKLPFIASDYEKNHPDWEVIGGINADQYIQSYGILGVQNGSDLFCPQPYYPMIADGDAWFSIPCWPVHGGGNIAAFIQGGVEDSIVNGSMNLKSGNIKLKGLFLAVYDENDEIVENFEIQKVNNKPSSGETAVWISRVENNKVIDMEVEGTNLFLVSKAIQAYMNNSVEYKSWKLPGDAVDALFAKGVIDSKTTSAKIGEGAFAIDTTNSEVLKALSVGKKVRVQYELEGVFSQVEAAIGYHTVQRMNNKDSNSTASYNTKSYARSLVGRKANGDIVLITVDMNHANAKGTSHNETNAVLKHYGCVEAYQMDGGGSVGAVLKDENGKFQYVNLNTEERKILSGLFFVERKKPEYDVKLTSVSETEAIFTVELKEDYNRKIEKVYIKVNDKNYEVIDGKATVTGLRKNRDYNWSLVFDDTSGKDLKTEYKGNLSTIKDEPNYRGASVNSSENHLTFTFDFVDRGKAVKEYSLIVGTNKIKGEFIDGEMMPISIPINESKEEIIFEYVYNIGREDITVRIYNPQFMSTFLASKMLSRQEQEFSKYFGKAK